MNIDHAYEESTAVGVQLTEEEHRHFAEMRTRLAPAFQAIVDIEAGLRGLTKREEKILNLVLDGRQNPEIRHELGIPEPTLKKDLSHLFAKFGVTTRATLCACIYRRS